MYIFIYAIDPENTKTNFVNKFEVITSNLYHNLKFEEKNVYFSIYTHENTSNIDSHEIIIYVLTFRISMNFPPSILITLGVAPQMEIQWS